MKLWIDDIRPAPEGYIWAKSVNEAKNIITDYLALFHKIGTSKSEFDFRVCDNILNTLIDSEIIDIDHDAGEYAKDGGDYIKLLDWLEDMSMDSFPIHIHSQNPVGVENMRRIIRKNGWKEV